tara:strand:+ start:3623 stop:3994 length:372 start_codon:yes stop_codon:yes gene_type:complete
MKNIEKAYIRIELGTATWNEDLSSSGEQDILDEGIECYAEDVYELIYDGYNISEEKLKMILDEHDNSDNMLYPLDCFEDLSYADWLEYRADRKADERDEKMAIFNTINYTGVCNCNRTNCEIC